MNNDAAVVYRVHFLGNDTYYQIYAKSIRESSLFGFLEVSELLFGEHSNIVIDPSQERLRTEFENVERLYIPMQDIVRIDEMTTTGAPKLTLIGNQKDNVRHFPTRPNREVNKEEDE